MNWASIFIYDTTWLFAVEILIRVTVMFVLIITFLRFTGKRGVRQLSIFELTIILSLGSIAGDPMFTEDLPIIQAVLIMGTVISLYRLCTWAIGCVTPPMSKGKKRTLCAPALTNCSTSDRSRALSISTKCKSVTLPSAEIV